MTTTQTPSTLLALHDADPERFLILALKLMGWESLGYTVCSFRGEWGPLSGYPPGTNHLDANAERRCPPRYHTSLDAVAELEAGLTDEEHEEFRQHLWEIVGLPDSDPFDWSMKRNRAYISAKPHLRLIAWVLTKQTI